MDTSGINNGLGFALFGIVIFIILLIPLIGGLALTIREYGKSLGGFVFGLVLLALFGLEVWFQPTRDMLKFALSIFGL